MRKLPHGWYLASMQNRRPEPDFGQLLAQIMDATSLNQAGLAAAGNVQGYVISRWARGLNMPSSDKLREFISGLARGYPAVADEFGPQLVQAAGMDFTLRPQPADDRPEIVRLNWTQPAVRSLWENEDLPPKTRLVFIEQWLADQAAEGKPAAAGQS